MSGLAPSADEPELLVSKDLTLELVLHEPDVANPIYLTFDERGRLWVVQYRQYPWPAGLKLLSRDAVWRNVYDPPFPPPPPHADGSPFRGKDRISIHEDTDGDGAFDRHKVFIDGLNLTTAALPGRDGVFVMNPPYLLFYADRDRNDVPDNAKPEILLSGFGIADSHAIANSLRWGPDGWIYATQGSTVSSLIATYDHEGKPRSDRPLVRSLGQNVWRYHPEQHRYEIFAEGGGNAFGVEIDSQGRIYSGHNGGDTRGFHYIQGGYWQKAFGKHGQLSNPYAFDYHQPMRHHAVQRFTHTFCIYEAEELPPRYHGKLFGINPVEHHVVLSSIEPDGSSRRTRDLGLLVKPGTGDRANWFTPVDIQLGPDGALYLADWYSVQPNHYRSHEGQTNPDLGRVYRLCSREFRPAAAFDMAELPSETLVVRYLFHPNRWYRQQTRRILGDRRDEKIVPVLWKHVEEQSGQVALESLWALHVSGGLTADRISLCLEHAEPHVRRWTVQLIGDQAQNAATWGDQLLRMAKREADLEVRSQLAATAKRLASNLAIPIVFTMLERAEDASDIYLPKTLWWSLEAHADNPDVILSALQESSGWGGSFRVAGFSFPQNLMRRYAIAGRQHDLETCAQLLRLAPNAEQREALVEAFATSFAGRSLPELPEALVHELAEVQGPYAQLMSIRRLDAAAIDAAIGSLRDGSLPAGRRVELIRALGEVRAAPSSMVDVLCDLLSSDAPLEIKNAAIVSLQKYAAPEIGDRLVSLWAKLPAESQASAVQVLASRRRWAASLLDGIEQGQIDKSLVDADAIGRLRRIADPELLGRVDKHFPVQTTSLSEMESHIEALEQVVRQGDGAPLEGRKLFFGKATCGKCHRLFHEGGEIGPDLTPYNRTDLSRLLLTLVNPSAEVREGFEVFTVLTDDGLALSGFKVEETDQLVALRTIDGQTHTIPKSQIEDISPNTTSLMPDGLLNNLSDEEIRDLFAFLGCETPPM
jgi:putative membrane-bound dehydrogenase-like protein